MPMKKLFGLLLFGLLLTFVLPKPDAQAKTDNPTKVEIYSMINAYRAEHGLPALEVSRSLERSADTYAFKLHTFYSDKLRHDNAWVNRQKRQTSELLAYAEDPVGAWRKSFRHNNILLSKRFTSMGLGTNKAGGYVLRVMDR
jgi:uncharacterized protein YkwD